MQTRTRRPSRLAFTQAQPFFSQNGQAAFFVPPVKPFGQQTDVLQPERNTLQPDRRKQQETDLTVKKQDTQQSLQREAGEKHDLTSTALANDPELEKCFDGLAVVKTPSKGDHVTKLQNALINLGFGLPKHGADSSYGDETTQAVRQFQQASGMSPDEIDGRVGKKTIGLLDRSLRNDQVAPDTDKVEDDFKNEDKNQVKKDDACKGKPARIPCPDPNTIVNEAADAAIAMIDKVLGEQLFPPTKTDKADYPDLFNRIFRFNDLGTMTAKQIEVRDSYLKIRAHLVALKTDKSLIQCGTDCDGGCRSRPAYHSLDDTNKHFIVFCPSVAQDPERNFIILHETHHAVIPGSRDKAYAFTRLFTRLDHKEALLNAASFHVYAAWVDKPDSQPVGQKLKDTNLVDDPIEKDRVAQALAHLEIWFSLIPFDLSTTIVGVEKANRTGQYEGDGAQIRMDNISQWFDLTRPPRRPTQADVQKLRAIEERVKKMEDVFKNPIVILPTDQRSFWEQGPGTSIAMNNELLQLDLDHMITALLQELVHATPSISAGREALYVGIINDLRNMRNLAP